MLDIFQLNQNKSKAAGIGLKQKMKGKSAFIVLLTEPCHFNGNITYIPDRCKAFSGNKDNESPRAAIIVHNTLNALKLPEFCDRDIVVVKVTMGKLTYLLTSMYSDINKDIGASNIDKVVEYADSKKYKLLICMDANAHSDLFGPDQNRRGDKLEEVIIRHNLNVENLGMQPTFETVRDGRL